MAAHRYWRFYMPQWEASSGSAATLTASTLELFDVAGVSLTRSAGGIASASSSDAAHPASMAWNATESDFWQNQSGSSYPHWVKWDFGAGNERDVVRMRFASLSTSNNPVNCWMQYSDNDTDWTNLFYFPHFVSGDPWIRDYSTGVLFASLSYQLAADPAGSVQLVPSLDYANSRSFGVPGNPTLTKRGMWWEGDGRIASTVKADTDGDGLGDVNLHREVLLVDDQSLAVVKIAWSDAVTGAYSFDNIRRGVGVTYTVYALDYENNYRAVIADRLTPEAMP